MTNEALSEERTHASQPKRYTPEAEVAIASHIANIRTSLHLAAERLSEHEEILRDDVHAAIAEVMAPKSIARPVSDWFKWIGFFALGLTVPTFISVLGAEKTDKAAVIVLTVSLIVSFALIAASLVLDVVGSRRTRPKYSGRSM